MEGITNASRPDNQVMRYVPLGTGTAAISTYRLALWHSAMDDYTWRASINAARDRTGELLPLSGMEFRPPKPTALRDMRRRQRPRFRPTSRSASPWYFLPFAMLAMLAMHNM